MRDSAEPEGDPGGRWPRALKHRRDVTVVLDSAMVAILATAALPGWPPPGDRYGVVMTSGALVAILMRRWLPLLCVVMCGAATVVSQVVGESVPMLPLATVIVAYSVGCHGRSASRRVLGAGVVLGAPLVAARLAGQGADLVQTAVAASGPLAWPAAALAAGLEIGRLRRRLRAAEEYNVRQQLAGRRVVEAERNRVRHELDAVIDWMRDNVFAQAGLAEDLLRSHRPHDVTGMAVAALKSASLSGDALAEVERLHSMLQPGVDPEPEDSPEPADSVGEIEPRQLETSDPRPALAGSP